MKQDCPDDEMLAGYLDGGLSDAERSDIETHLSSCDSCLEGIIITKDLTRGASGSETEPVPESVTQSAVDLINEETVSNRFSIAERIERLFRSIYRGLFDTLIPQNWGSAPMAMIRGTNESIPGNVAHIEKDFKEIHAEIEIEKTRQHTSQIRVTVTDELGKMRDIRVTLERDEREVSSLLMGRDSVVFDDIPFGHYRLVLGRDSEEIGTYSFEVKEARNAG